MSSYTLEKYVQRRDKLLTEPLICEANRNLFRRFFEYQERKLKRQNRLSELDTNCVRTLIGYVYRIQNVNKWFLNKPFINLTEDDIRRVYDALEDGKIVSARGGRFGCLSDYYNKIFKSKLFAMAGKRDLAKAVIEYSTRSESVVRFTTESDVRRIAAHAYRPLHRLLVWLEFDFGENVNSTLQLDPADFTRQLNPNTGDPEYRLRLRREILKRSRTPRSEITNFPETVQLLDDILPKITAGQKIFPFTYHSAAKFLYRAARDAGVKCQPLGDKITWKDFRSGMACDLLRKRWSSEEINARLGHRPSSPEIDKYINFFALDRHQPKAKTHQFELAKVEERLVQETSRANVNARRLTDVEEELAFMRSRFRDLSAILQRNPVLADVEMALAIKASTGEITESPRAAAAATAQLTGSASRNSPRTLPKIIDAPPDFRS